MDYDPQKVREAMRQRDEYHRAERGDRALSVWHKVGWAFDRMLYTLMPVTAAKRMATRHRFEVMDRRLEQLKGRSFAGARDEEHREGRWIVSRLSPDSASEEDLAELQHRCAEMLRNSNIANSAIESRVGNEIGVGLLPKPMVREVDGVIMKEAAAQFNDEIKEIYKHWAKKGVDRSRILSLPQFQKQVCRCFATFGEAFVLFGVSPSRSNIELSMELIAVERVSTPYHKAYDDNCVMGVQYDERGETILGYWVRDRHPGDLNKESKNPDKWTFYPRFDENGRPRMCHIFEPMFPGQSRGIPWMASCINRMKDTDDMFEAELILKQVESCLGVIITSGDESDSPLDMAKANANDTDNRGNRIEELYPGMINYQKTGTEITTIDPNRPGQTFAPFIEQSLRTIAAALNMPYEILAKNFIRVTYSSGRLAMLDGRNGFRMRTQTLKDMWLCHLHELIVYEAIFMGLVKEDYIEQYNLSPWIFERHDWRSRNSGLMDPEKERKGHKIGLDTGLDTRSSILGEEARDIEEAEEELIAEGRMQVEREVALAVYRKELEEQAGLEPGQSIPIADGGSIDVYSPEPEPIPVGAE